MKMTKSYNVWSEFQPLEKVAIGNINTVDEIDVPLLGQEHQDNLSKVF